MIRGSSNIRWILFLVAAVMTLPTDLSTQQIPIGRIEQMPQRPTPYLMRDWKRVAVAYDSLVFDWNSTGQYLPLFFWRPQSVNYPGHESFGLHTYVGTAATYSGEAINVLPAVIGATLAGIDKSNQKGYNWVLMCEEFFNRRPAENIYLNHPVASSGSDWWYETMPNVFFYQLYDLYTNTGDFAYQFRTVADQWLRAVIAMGGSATPWRKPNMAYRAWSFSTMTPNATGVPQPEAAGAIAWILYHAFVETGEVRYRLGAEWAMEFLSGYSSNPSYELQLPYGALAAAKMNAELGTMYDVAKLVRWCFDVGWLRSWGAMLGTWGGYDVHGLIGEVNYYNDYAFLMNTFQQAGALVPLVRYDDRFARAIGKWVLNAANATRLFYAQYLPDNNQDNEVWSRQYDPESTIGYEALRQYYGGASPYATGDAIRGGWASTNLALYGSSHVGIFAGIIDTTNVEMVLKLDVLKTDYFRRSAYPTFLFYNPHDEEKAVEIDVGSSVSDLYDAVSNTFISRTVTGTATFSVPADAAVLLVITPSGGTITFDLDRMLVNGVVVDYRSDQVVSNYPPRIKALATPASVLLMGRPVPVYCTASDKDGDPLTYRWNTSGGSILGEGNEIIWVAPDSPAVYAITCLVSDGKGGVAVDTVEVNVVESMTTVPVIESIKARPRKMDLRATSELTCTASDSGGGVLTYIWTAAHGLLSGEGPVVQWLAPGSVGNYWIRCTVRNESGAEATDSVQVAVRDFSVTRTGDLVAHYPFNGNAEDVSGFGHHGTVSGAALTMDRIGTPNSAYLFDGIDDHVRVTNTSALNFQDAITVSFWMRVDAFFPREAHPISHGSWQNRWKISISDHRVRWTVKSDNGIRDLDSETILSVNTFYHITALYDGSDFELYLNGELDALTTFSGTILPTNIDLMIAQVLPGNSQYNFKGVLDDIRIYNYPLSVKAIQDLYTGITGIEDQSGFAVPTQFRLHPNFPNPFNSSTTIRFELPTADRVVLTVHDVLGRSVANLLSERLEAGTHVISWDAGNLASGIYIYTLQAGRNRASGKMLLLR